MAAGAGFAVLAALGFGCFIVGIDAGADESASWAMVAARTASVSVGVVVALILSKPLRPPRELLPLLAAVGIFDTGASVLVATATTYGAAGIVAVLSALYPVVTIVLARLVLGERLSASKRFGGGVALAGAAFVAAG
jgi:drug/metabolite transporter (DMT)-like permease